MNRSAHGTHDDYISFVLVHFAEDVKARYVLVKIVTLYTTCCVVGIEVEDSDLYCWIVESGDNLVAYWVDAGSLDVNVWQLAMIVALSYLLAFTNILHERTHRLN